jgi:hypothetical protein
MCERSMPILYLSLSLTVDADGFLGAHEGPRRDAHGRCRLITLFGWAWSHTQIGPEPLLGFVDFGVPPGAVLWEPFMPCTLASGDLV